MEYLKKLDYLSYQAHFTFNEKGDKRYKTILGGILSLISILLSMGFSLYFLQRFILKKDSSIITSTEKNNNITIPNSYKLPFILRLTDIFSIPISDNVYNITLLVWYSYFNEKKNELIQDYDIVLIEKCNIENHFSEYKQYFSKISSLDSYYCPIQRLKNQSLLGIYGDNHPFIYYTFYFSKCENITHNNLCLPKEKIDSILSNAYLDIKFLTYSFNYKTNDMKNLEIQSDRYFISTKIYKTIWLYFNLINFIDDKGYIFSNYKKEQFHQFDYGKIDYDLVNLNLNNNTEIYLSLAILNNGKIITVKRNYLKFLDYLANLGGVIKAISFICYSINYFNSRNLYYKAVIKEYIIENQIKNHKIIKINSLNNVNDKSKGNLIQSAMSLNDFSYKKNKIPLNKKNSNILDKLKQKEKIEKNFRFSLLPLIFFPIRKHDKKIIYWNIKIINRRLNIINVLNVLERSEQLRKDFDKEQSNINISESNISPQLKHINTKFNNNYINNNNKETKSFII